MKYRIAMWAIAGFLVQASGRFLPSQAFLLWNECGMSGLSSA
jgi:hypothetical protein